MGASIGIVFFFLRHLRFRAPRPGVKFSGVKLSVVTISVVKIQFDAWNFDAWKFDAWKFDAWNFDDWNFDTDILTLDSKTTRPPPPLKKKLYSIGQKFVSPPNFFFPVTTVLGQNWICFLLKVKETVFYFIITYF